MIVLEPVSGLLRVCGREWVLDDVNARERVAAVGLTLSETEREVIAELREKDVEDEGVEVVVGVD